MIAFSLGSARFSSGSPSMDDKKRGFVCEFANEFAIIYHEHESSGRLWESLPPSR